LTKGYGDYASDLTTLEAAQLIDSVLTTGTKVDYAYTIAGGGSTFTVGSRPVSYRNSGFRSFYGDEKAMIRFTTQDREATASDPPLGN
jgi:hypothetical protein